MNWSAAPFTALVLLVRSTERPVSVKMQLRFVHGGERELRSRQLPEEGRGSGCNQGRSLGKLLSKSELKYALLHLTSDTSDLNRCTHVHLLLACAWTLTWNMVRHRSQYTVSQRTEQELSIRMQFRILYQDAQLRNCYQSPRRLYTIEMYRYI
jgi:hypothetical protein